MNSNVIDQVLNIGKVYNNLGRQEFRKIYPTIGTALSTKNSHMFSGAVLGGVVGQLRSDQDGIDLGGIAGGALIGTGIGFGVGSYFGRKYMKNNMDAAVNEMGKIKNLAASIASGK